MEEWLDITCILVAYSLTLLVSSLLLGLVLSVSKFFPLAALINSVFGICL